jgi:hypothetical protein
MLLNELLISYTRPFLQKKNARKGPVPKTQTRIQSQKSLVYQAGRNPKIPKHRCKPSLDDPLSAEKNGVKIGHGNQEKHRLEEGK